MRHDWPLHVTPILATYTLWALWFASWWIAALWRVPTTKRPMGPLVVLDRLLLASGFVLLFGLVREREVPSYLTLPDTAAWALLGVASAGFAICWWARLHLGRLWSSTITLKEGHRIVNTGPYSIVRHPIYAGLLLDVAATAAQRAALSAFVGAAVILVALLARIWREEQFLSAELGSDAYAAYRARVPALVPFLLP